MHSLGHRVTTSILHANNRFRAESVHLACLELVSANTILKEDGELVACTPLVSGSRKKHHTMRIAQMPAQNRPVFAPQFHAPGFNISGTGTLLITPQML